MAAAFAGSLVKLELAGSVATITITRPDALNSLNPAVVHQLQLAFDIAAGDSNVRGIVLAGEGKAFVMGADIDFFIRNIKSGDIDRIVQFTQAGQRLLNAIDDCPKRVVACVHGAALGAGVEMALACDFVVAARNASFALPETGLGIYPGLGGTQRAPRALGAGLARWLIYSGKTVSAADAWQVGMAQQVLPVEQMPAFCADLAIGQVSCDPPPPKSAQFTALEQFFAQARVDDLLTGQPDVSADPTIERAVRSVRSKSPLALRLAEQLIDQGLSASVARGLQGEIDHLSDVFRSPETLRRMSGLRG